MAKKYWLLKTEPTTYSYKDLIKEKNTAWTGVRNFQARNFLKEFQLGDLALIYHSGEERAVVGIAEVTRGAYPDRDRSRAGEWIQVDLRAKKELSNPVTLLQIKKDSDLKQILLIKQSRLSVLPLSQIEFKKIVELGE